LTHRKHFPTLAEVASAAIFAISGQAAALTGAVISFGGGTITD